MSESTNCLQLCKYEWKEFAAEDILTEIIKDSSLYQLSHTFTPPLSPCFSVFLFSFYFFFLYFFLLNFRNLFFSLRNLSAFLSFPYFFFCCWYFFGLRWRFYPEILQYYTMIPQRPMIIVGDFDSIPLFLSSFNLFFIPLITSVSLSLHSFFFIFLHLSF